MARLSIQSPHSKPAELHAEQYARVIDRILEGLLLPCGRDALPVTSCSPICMEARSGATSGCHSAPRSLQRGVLLSSSCLHWRRPVLEWVFPACTTARRAVCMADAGVGSTNLAANAAAAQFLAGWQLRLAGRSGTTATLDTPPPKCSPAPGAHHASWRAYAGAQPPTAARMASQPDYKRVLQLLKCVQGVPLNWLRSRPIRLPVPC